MEMIQCDMIRQILLLLDYLPESDYCVNPSPDSCQQQATHIQKKGHWVCKDREDNRERKRDTGNTTSSLTEGLRTVVALLCPATMSHREEPEVIMLYRDFQ